MADRTKRILEDLERTQELICLRTQIKEWAAAFDVDDMPELVTPGHAVQWVRGMLKERDTLRTQLEASQREASPMRPCPKGP